MKNQIYSAPEVKAVKFGIDINFTYLLRHIGGMSKS